MSQELEKKPGSAMTQSELQEDRIHKFDGKNRFQWKGNSDSGSELKKDISSTGLMRKDMNADPLKFSPGTLSDRHSASYRARCPEILEMKCYTKLKSAAFEDEYRPLPSSARFSLRTKRSPSRSKEGARVTFAEDRSDDLPPKKSSGSQTEALPSSMAERPEAWCFSPHPRRGHPRWGSLTGPEALTDSPARRRDVRAFQPCSDLCPCSTPSQLTLTQPKTAAPDPKLELEPNSRSFFKRTSDLYVATHLPEEASRFRNFLEVSQSCGSSLRSHSLDRLLDSHLPGTQGASQSHTSQRPSPPASPSGLESTDLQSLSSSLCTTVSAYQPRTAIKNYPARGREDLGLREGECLARTPPPPISELSSVLRQLLDLVDQHWSGPCSLQLNPRFLTPAYDLLASLTSPSLARFERGRSPWRMKDVDKNGDKSERVKDSIALGLNSSDLKHQKNQPTQTHQQMESLKKSATTAMGERNSLHCETVNSKPESALNIFETGREWDKCLQRQVEALREQERHFKRLEETMGLLQDSHRSLLSSNNSLMEQFNNPSSNQNTDTHKFVSHHEFRKAANLLSPSSMQHSQQDKGSLTVTK
ncbi:leucine-rich repeat-containing protein 36-like isoform X1 [Anguilla rostrata]|uniref:leucine-rich repeat-containing protein 36-like isoform X1 n=1 Tax=Anguilla rostrata TaxID=7938 RepID=UPI0030CB6CFD